MDRLLHGDLPGAEAEFADAARRADALGFPQGPHNHVYATDIEIEMRAWASQFDRARALIADMIEKAERYGFDFFQMYGATEQCLIDSYELLATEQPDEAALSAQIDATAGFIEFWRSVGLYAYQTRHDCILGQLLTAAGQPDQARARLDTALQIAEDTGMHLYDAELLRARAHTYTRRGHPRCRPGRRHRAGPTPGRATVRIARRTRRLRTARAGRSSSALRGGRPPRRRQRPA